MERSSIDIIKTYNENDLTRLLKCISVNAKLSSLGEMDLNNVENVIFNYHSGMRELYNKYATPHKVTIKCDMKAFYAWCCCGNPTKISMVTPEDSNELYTKGLENIDLSKLGYSYKNIKELSRKALNWGILLHEDFHNIFSNYFKSIYSNTTISNAVHAFSESFAVLSEYMITELINNNKDCKLSDKEKEDIKTVCEFHRLNYSQKKLESKPDSQYNEWDDRLLFTKIYQEFGKSGVAKFFENMDFQKIVKIKKYEEGKESQVLTEEYKELLDMDADSLVKSFSKA